MLEDKLGCDLSPHRRYIDNCIMEQIHGGPATASRGGGSRGGGRKPPLLMGNPTQRGGGATSPRGGGFQSSRGGSGSKCSREQPIPFMYPPPKSNTVLPPPDMYFNQEYPAITPQQHLPPPAAPLPPPPAPGPRSNLESRKPHRQEVPSRSEDKSEMLIKKSPMKARRDIFVDGMLC
eukprot:sb/3471883/